MYKPVAIPPIQGVENTPTRDALMALSEGWQVRNSSGEDGFVVRAEFTRTLRHEIETLRAAMPESSEGARGRATGVSSGSSDNIKVTYPFVQNPVVLNQSYPIQYLYDNLVFTMEDFGNSINGLRNLQGTWVICNAVRSHTASINNILTRIAALEAAP